MLMHTEGIVLRSMPYKETTRLVTLYACELGKTTVIAKGGQSVKSRFGSTLQLLSHVHAVIYTRPTRSIQILSDCSHVKIYSEISGNLERLAIGQRIGELVLSLTEEGHASPETFQLLVQVLGALNTPSINAMLLKLYFQLRFTDLLGFAPAFSRESVLEISKSGGYLSLEDGTIQSRAVHKTSVMHASRSVLRAFAILHRADFDAVLRMQLTARELRDLSALITRFMRYHLQDAYPVRGEKVVDQLLKSEKRQEGPA